jgi:hypothetical protein
MKIFLLMWAPQFFLLVSLALLLARSKLGWGKSFQHFSKNLLKWKSLQFFPGDSGRAWVAAAKLSNNFNVQQHQSIKFSFHDLCGRLR